MMGPHYVTVYQIGADKAFSSWADLVKLVPAIFGVTFLANSAVLSFVSTKIRERWLRFSLIIVAVFFGAPGILLVGVVQPRLLHRDSEPLLAYQKGNFLTVEGPVTDFDPMPYDGHKNECFSVEDKRFCYSDYAIEAGFRNTASHGGPIRSGLQVRVAFISTVRRNAILRLEVAENPAKP